ncbi:MAG: hypothetical protein AABP62_09460 [Planctomycetota bacterium]
MTLPTNAISDSAVSSETGLPRGTVLPRQHGSILCVPEWKETTELVGRNRAAFAASQLDVQGMPLTRLRDWTRITLLDAATRYTSSLLGSDISPCPTEALIVTGHQPELFHAGVWAKNFAAAGLARHHRGVALNLVVDNDTIESTRLRVPVGPPSAPRIERIPIDADRQAQPWEDATIVDRASFREFGSHVSELLRRNWSYEPLLAQCWPAAVRQSEVSNRLCDVLTAVRVASEREHGLTNLELPMSRVCETEPFRWFAAHLLAHLPRVHSLYNAAVRQYRLAHRLRNHTHPVPDLETRDGWLEAPFWLWRAGDLHRDRPFVRQVGSELELRDGREVLARWTQTETGSAETTVAILTELSQRGFRLRTRALTTTLFARLCLADLFIHGIGGAKYDDITDRLFEQLFHVAAPRFATVSATFHLPLGGSSLTSSHDERRLSQQLRDLRYNPDRHVTAISGSTEAALVEEKQVLLAALGIRRPTALETRRIVQINAALATSTNLMEQQWQSERDAMRRRRAADSIRQDREFAWCLHPQDELPQKLLAAFQR